MEGNPNYESSVTNDMSSDDRSSLQSHSGNHRSELEAEKIAPCCYFYALGIVDTLYLILMAIPWFSLRLLDIYNIKGVCHVVYRPDILRNISMPSEQSATSQLSRFLPSYDIYT
ncbi:hypothetical protein MAR_017553 [Mya arenaria]|uniref:Uncharacterized protein n=1 Tax=Mya arenaria TaxID=6604 RepID=A0ABY7EC57_MYAAR|nr:hypothetical protein MAR_017553 [Mya arenaria]